MLIEKVIGRVEEYELSDYEVDIVKLTQEELTKSHQRLVTEKGIEIGMSLDIGCSLESGDVLYCNDKRIIVVEGKEEDVLVIEPHGRMEWGLACFNLGNLHSTAFLNDGFIIVPYDYVIEGIFKKLKITCCQERRKITGVRANSHRH